MMVIAIVVAMAKRKGRPSAAGRGRDLREVDGKDRGDDRGHERGVGPVVDRPGAQLRAVPSPICSCSSDRRTRASKGLPGDPLTQERVHHDVAPSGPSRMTRSARTRAPSDACTLDAPPSRYRVRTSAESTRPSSTTIARRAARWRERELLPARLEQRLLLDEQAPQGAMQVVEVTSRVPPARASSHVSCASRWTSYGRLPASSTMAAPSPGSALMPVRRNRASMKAAKRPAPVSCRAA